MSDIPNTDSQSVAQIAVAWEITKLAIAAQKPEATTAQDFAVKIGETFQAALRQIAGAPQ